MVATRRNFYSELFQGEKISEDENSFEFVSKSFRLFLPIEEFLHVFLLILLVDLLAFAFQIGIERSFHLEFRSFDVNFRRTKFRLVQHVDAQLNRFGLNREGENV